MRKPKPFKVSRALLNALLQQGMISYDRENSRAYWLGTVLNFSPAQNICFAVLWQNLEQGNLPIPQQRVIQPWRGTSTNVAFIFKRHIAWRQGVIVGDGRGNLWLYVPESVVDQYDQAA